jgi:hypothetical protein
VHGTDGRPLAVCPSPLTYRMLRSTDFERLVHSRIARSPATRILRATADTLRSTADGAEVRCTGPDDRTLTLRARHVFDSRPRRTLTDLFRRVPPERLLRFLDGDTSPWEEWSIGLRTPVGPMLRTAMELPFLPRRPPLVP